MTASKPWLTRSVVAALACVLTMAACGDDDANPPTGVVGPGATGSSSSGMVEPCAEGAVQSCSVTLGQHNGVLSCYKGEQVCDENGEWGDCSGGTVSSHKRDAPDQDASAFKPASLGPAADCVNNPCDPECQAFDEIPTTPWTNDGVSILYSWPYGDPGLVPADVDNTLHNEPCTTAQECQGNSYCYDPGVPTCQHPLCATGSGLDPLNCGDCAQDICTTMPQCCGDGQAGGCAHAECTTGLPLATGCTSCVTAVCASDPACCNNTWDQTCVNLAATLSACSVSNTACFSTPPNNGTCGHALCTTGLPLLLSCSTCVTSVCGYDNYCCQTAWDGICVNEVQNDPNCAGVCGGTATVACHDPCTTGTSLAPHCGDYVEDVCAGDPTCCDQSGSWTAACVTAYSAFEPGGCPLSAGIWDANCVAAVENSCGSFCPESPATPAGTGSCTSWGPATVDPACPTRNLTVGLTCDGTIPICNHGALTAPTGMEVVVVPPGSYFGEANPTLPPGAITCITQSSIPAGECIGVTGCGPLNPDDQIFVNPPGPNQVAECEHRDNWGVYVPGACGNQGCAGVQVAASIKQVNMFITTDKSGSMGSWWTQTKDAFSAFFADPGAAGLNIGLEFFPQGDCDAQCGNPNGCANPHVPFGLLTNQAAPADTQEAALIQGFNDFSPGGGTPAILALQGAIAWSEAHKAAFPTEEHVVILITDGAPNTCGSNQSLFTSAAAAAFNNSGIRTYGIGIVGADETLLNAMAAAGGGQAFFLSSGGTVEQDLLTALLAIKGQSLSCDVDLPNGNYLPEEGIMYYTPGGSNTRQQVPLVADSTACGSSGWYVNGNKITMCPNTCQTVQSDPAAEIDFDFPCLGGFDPTVHTELYEAECPEGLTPQWGFLGYDAAAAGDSHATFEARTADTVAALPSQTLFSLADAHAVPTDTQQCPMNGSVAGCPVDMFNAIGEPEVHRKFLELKVTLHPSTNQRDSATVNGFQVTYTCYSGE